MPKIVFLLSGPVIFLLVLEGLLRVSGEKRQIKKILDMTPAASVKAEPWFSLWEKEHDRLLRTFQAYELYTLEPHEGEILNINQHGNRMTVNPEFDPHRKVSRVGLFGGSTMWGSLVRDEFTIASSLSRVLNQDSLEGHEVVNYAEVGFVLSQEIHRAIRLLSEENPPLKAAVFFDGINDSLAALTNFSMGVDFPAGLPWEYGKYKYLFQLGKTGEVSFSDVLKKFRVVRDSLEVATRLGWLEQDKEKNFWRQPTSSQLREIAERAANKYLKLARVGANALKANGVQPIFVLQPYLSNKSKLSAEEQGLLQRNKHWQPFLIAFYDHVKEQSSYLGERVNFFDLTGAFSNHEKTCYADILHYTEYGNKIIAKELARVLSSVFPKPLVKSKQQTI